VITTDTYTTGANGNNDAGSSSGTLVVTSDAWFSCSTWPGFYDLPAEPDIAEDDPLPFRPVAIRPRVGRPFARVRINRRLNAPQWSGKNFRRKL
jgi:hypothetical protein